MDAVTVHDVFQQIITGEDIPRIDTLLKRMKPEFAAQRPSGWPYSILTNLEHADFWQRIWLARIEGNPRPNMLKDWREPHVSEFPGIRSSFLTNLQRAAEIAKNWPMQHSMESDVAALHTLSALAVHDAYHIGQIKLMASILSKGTN